MVAKQYALYQTVTAPLILVVVFHSFYVMDALYQEPAIFTQMDVTTDGFGLVHLSLFNVI